MILKTIFANFSLTFLKLDDDRCRLLSSYGLSSMDRPDSYSEHHFSVRANFAPVLFEEFQISSPLDKATKIAFRIANRNYLRDGSDHHG